MKLFTLFACLVLFNVAYAQSLPIDFESAVTTSDFTDFDGGTATVIANPQSGGINTSGKVAQIIRDGGQVWAGSKIVLDNNLDLSTDAVIRMKVFVAAPAGTIVKMKLEGGAEYEIDRYTTVSNQWETLEWDFTGVKGDYNTLVFMFDFGNVGDGSATSTFLFDDIELIFGGTQVDLPVDFESNNVNYTISDFGGNVSSMVTDPEDGNNHVIKVVKTDSAATWAGSTIGTPTGFATNIPLTMNDSFMTVRVWSPAAGTPIRLKVEDANDPTHTCETETNTTVDGGWEVLTFDFTNEAAGTAELSVGLSQSWVYNMASIFFNFGTDGATAGEQTYYFDDVAFGQSITGFEENISTISKVYPNPTNGQWNITSSETITAIALVAVSGKQVLQQYPNSLQVTLDGSGLASGVYFAKVTTKLGISTTTLIRK